MKFRNIISALTASCMIFSSIACSAAEENKTTDNFESYTSVANEGPWTTKNPIVTEADGNKAGGPV